MAVRKIAMVVNLRQNKNQSATHFGKWYPPDFGGFNTFMDKTNLNP